MKKKVILVGASTGGPTLIKKMLSQITKLDTTVIVAQHMREEVLPFFIKDIKESLNFDVKSTPTMLSVSHSEIIICSHSSVLQKNNGLYEIVTQIDNQHYTPDINKLFNSFVNHSNDFDIKILIMTGIGRDGVDGAINLKQKGATIIAQDESSSPVYGMPKATLESGIVDEVKTFDEIKEYFKAL